MFYLVLFLLFFFLSICFLFSWRHSSFLFLFSFHFLRFFFLSSPLVLLSFFSCPLSISLLFSFLLSFRLFHSFFPTLIPFLLLRPVILWSPASALPRPSPPHRLLLPPPPFPVAVRRLLAFSCLWFGRRVVIGPLPCHSASATSSPATALGREWRSRRELLLALLASPLAAPLGLIESHCWIVIAVAASRRRIGRRFPGPFRGWLCRVVRAVGREAVCSSSVVFI